MTIVRDPVMLGNDHNLFGVLTRRNRNRSTVGAILLNAGLLHNVGPFRLHVNIADALAEIGVPSIRLDQSGKGESPARKGLSRNESIVADFDDAFASLSQFGVETAILIGLCSGADDSTIIVSERPSVGGLIILDGYAETNFRAQMIRYGNKLGQVKRYPTYLRALFRLLTSMFQSGTLRRRAEISIDIRDWEDTATMKQRYLSHVGRGSKILGVFSAGQEYYNHVGQLRATIGQTRYRHLITEAFFNRSDHTYSDPEQRAQLVETIQSWANDFVKEYRS